MNVKPGDVFWISPKESNGIASDHTHPYVVIHDGPINTVVVCALTSNLKRAKEPGNVLLEEGEANLPKQSVVVVSKEFTLDTIMLGQYIGTVNEQRINQVLAGLRFLKSMIKHHA
ncbi:MAG TPA: type II toxin-antitoxin system PemK/MazF family toxin [Anaerolineales bacterium]|nr:type II toxin-antitoxin system PemK/MazF family toxin [Anaerolineales bacterium]